MKTITEIQAWCQGAFEQYGDPSAPCGQIFARFVDKDPGPTTDILAQWQAGVLAIRLSDADWLPVPIDVEGPVANEETGALEKFGISEVCPHFWTLSPSLNIPGAIHAFVHIYNTPITPPWKSLIVPVTRIPPGLSFLNKTNGGMNL